MHFLDTFMPRAVTRLERPRTQKQVKIILLHIATSFNCPLFCKIRLQVYTVNDPIMRQNRALTKIKRGRPTVLSNETVAKICEVLQRGFSVQAACNYAGIDRATFYRHMHSDPIFLMKIRFATMFLYTAATENIYNKIVYEKDVKLSKWYLEKFDPIKFSGKRLCRECKKLNSQYNHKATYFPAN